MRRKTLILFILIVTACAPKADPNAQIQQSVAATVAAMPIATTNPLPTPYPSPTPFDLKGLFCEYQFCIGHPIDMSFFDVTAQKNPASTSSYSQGVIAMFNGNLFIQMIWQLAPDTKDPQFMLDLILDSRVDSRLGNLDVKLVRDMNVIYTSISTTATSVLPFGAAGVWICGDRAFAWKVYSPQAENVQTLFDSAFSRFTCNR